MKKFFLALFFALLSSPVFAQSVGPLDAYVWDYRDTDLTTYNVVRFKFCVDTTCQSVGLTPWPNPTVPAPAGFTAYGNRIGAQTVGPHTVSVQACYTPDGNDAGCGGALSTNFTFELVPPTASNGRFDRSQ